MIDILVTSEMIVVIIMNGISMLIKGTSENSATFFYHVKTQPEDSSLYHRRLSPEPGHVDTLI